MIYFYKKVFCTGNKGGSKKIEQGEVILAAEKSHKKRNKLVVPLLSYQSAHGHGALQIFNSQLIKFLNNFKPVGKDNSFEPWPLVCAKDPPMIEIDFVAGLSKSGV